MEWLVNDDGSVDGIRRDGITICHIRYAQEGEVEGGLGVLMRFMAGSQGAHQPPLSPSGWYWQGTVQERGVWCSPRGPYSSFEEARSNAEETFSPILNA